MPDLISKLTTTIPIIKVLPNPFSAIIFFLILTLIYGVVMIFIIINESSQNLTIIEGRSKNNIFTLIYGLLILGGVYFINLNIHKSFCIGANIKYYNVFIYTLLPWTIVFGILFFILDIFEGWVQPFANTIGYGVVSILGIEDILSQILDFNKAKRDNKETTGNTTIASAIINIESDKTRFINQFDYNSAKFLIFMNKLNQAGLIKKEIQIIKSDDTTDPNIAALYRLVNIKLITGKLMWYLLAGTLIASISYNYIINIKCESAISDTQSKIEDLYTSQNTPIYGIKWQFYDLGEITDSNEMNEITELILPNVNQLKQLLRNKVDSTGIAIINDTDNSRLDLHRLTLTQNNFVITDNSDIHHIKGFRPVG